MTTSTAERRVWRRGLPAARILRDGAAIYWWAEIIFIGIYYFVYSAIRNANGNDPPAALRNARWIISFQGFFGLNHEHTLQQWALHFKPLIIACNYFYGSLHFIVTIGVLIFLFRKYSNDYPLARNTLAIATGLALIGFTLVPLMPPRLLPSHQGFQHFVDTVDKYPAFWSFKRGAVAKISNQFAAMPSVHCAWALWCAVALVPRLRRRWAKILAALYPVCTVTAIVLTANHYFIDAVAGFFVLGVGFLLARAFTRAGRSTPDAPGASVVPPEIPPAQPVTA